MSVARSEFLRAMRTVASSVSIVTTDGNAGRHGATVSAFCSVSADPPSVLICLRRGSRIASRVLANGFFCINVLDAETPEIAERFAEPEEARSADRFSGVALDAGAETPHLSAAASAFACRVVRDIPYGSHVIFIGEVLETRVRSGKPLARLAGRYGSVDLKGAPPPAANGRLMRLGARSAPGHARRRELG